LVSLEEAQGEPSTVGRRMATEFPDMRQRRQAGATML
jgi:hypothetical protein